MSTVNLPSINLSPDTTARVLGLMLVAWQPFISGARLPSLLLFLLGAWMLWRKRIDFQALAVKRMGLLFLLLLIPILLSLPGSFDPKGSLSVAALLPLFYVVGLALLQGLSTPAGREWLQRWLLVVLLIWLGDGYIQFAFGRDLLGVPMNADGRILGPFADNLHLGFFLAVLLPAILWRLAAERPRQALLIIALTSFIVGMNGARSGVLMLVLACITLLPRFTTWRYRALMAMALTSALVAALLFSPVISEQVKRLANLGNQTEASLFQQLNGVLSGRVIIWETAWQMIRDRPLTGVGAKAFAEAYDRYVTRAEDPFRYPRGVYVYHAHQMYVSVAAESGMIGLAGLIAVIGLCAAWYCRAPPERRRQAAPFAAPLAVIAFPLQSQPVLYTIWWFPIVLLLLCAMLAALGNSNPSLRSGRE